MNHTPEHLIDGKDIRMGRTVYTVPAMSARQFSKHRATLQMLAALASREPNDEEMTAFVEMVHAVLTRNYPDLAIDTVWDMLDLRCMTTIIEAITGRGGNDANTIN